MFQALFGFNFSVIVSIGYVAAFGMATQTGVIMLVYLREAIERRGGLEGMSSLEELRRAVIEGAVHRLRPKLLTEGVAIIGLVPMLWATGTGAEIMRPMAAPVLGGLLISDESNRHHDPGSVLLDPTEALAKAAFAGARSSEAIAGRTGRSTRRGLRAPHGEVAIGESGTLICVYQSGNRQP